MTRQSALLSGLLATLLVTSPAFAQDAAKASRFYEDALQRYEKRDFSGAIVQLKNALQADKSQLSVHVLLGKSLLADNQPAAAEFQFSEAIRLGLDRAEAVVPLADALIQQGKQPQMLSDPRLAPAGLPAGIRQQLLLERGAAQSDIGDGKGALASVMEARAINPADVNSWIAEVPLRVRNRQFTEAMAAADQAVKLAPDSAEAVYQRGSVMHATNQITQALAVYDRALQLSPKHAESRLARAGILTDLKRDAEALAEINELQTLRPKDPRGVYLRAVIADRAGDAAASKTALKQITDLLDPVSIEFLRYRLQFLMLNGLAHYGLGELEKAKPYLELASKQQANSPLNKLLAQIAMAEPNPNRAIELLEDYVKVHPGDGQALLMLASAHMSQGRHARAAKLMQDALKTRDAPEYRTALGLSLLQSGKGTMAAEELAKAYKADPRQTFAGLALAAVYLRDGESKKALQVADTLARSQPNNATVIMVQAYAKSRAGDLPGARSGYEKALKLDPKLIEAQLGLARLDTMTGAFEDANKRLRTVLKAQERNVDVLFELALLHEQWGRPDEALKWLESAAEASSGRETRANFALIAWHLRQGQPSRAVDAGKVLLAKLPEDVEALQAYAAAQFANGDPAGAKATLTNASRRAGYSAPRLVEVARQQVQLKDFAGAAYSLDKALNDTPDYLPAQAMLASVDLARGDAAASERRARQLIQANPKSPVGYTLLAEVAQVRGQYGPALDALRQAHDIEKSTGSLTRLLRAMALQNNTKGADELGEAWLKRNPSDMAVRIVMGELNVRVGNFAAARKQYEAVLKLRPNDGVALNNLANVLIELKDRGAVDVAERALKLNPRDATLLDTAGWAHHQAGNGERALQLLRDARLRAPTNPDIRYHLGEVLAKAGRKREAIEELNAAIRDGGNFSHAADAKKLLATLN